MPKRFELDADTVIETRDHGAMTVAKLERLMRGREPPTTLALLGQLFTIGRGCGQIRTSSTGAVTASASTTP